MPFEKKNKNDDDCVYVERMEGKSERKRDREKKEK